MKTLPLMQNMTNYTVETNKQVAPISVHATEDDAIAKAKEHWEAWAESGVKPPLVRVLFRRKDVVWESE